MARACLLTRGYSAEQNGFGGDSSERPWLTHPSLLFLCTSLCVFDQSHGRTRCNVTTLPSASFLSDPRINLVPCFLRHVFKRKSAFLKKGYISVNITVAPCVPARARVCSYASFVLCFAGHDVFRAEIFLHGDEM